MSNHKVLRWCFLFSLIAGSYLYGQRAIVEIAVEVAGSGRVTEKYVQDNIRIKNGDKYVRSRLNEDVVGLMKTGRFEDVQVLEENVGTDGVKLVVRVRAFPLVTDVKLLLLNRQIQLGEMITNPALADLMESEYLSVKNSKLVKKLKMVKGQQFNAARLHADEKALENEYIMKGYYPVKVKGQRIGGSVRYIISEGEKFRIERGEMVFESVVESSLSFSQKVLRKKVKTRQRRVWYSPVSWFMDDGKLKPKEYREDVEKLESFYRDQGYLDVQVQISHGADKVLASPDYGALRAKLFQSRFAHAKAVEDLDDAERRLADVGEDDNESELERLVNTAESKLDDAEDMLDDAEDEFEDYMDEEERVPFVFSIKEGPQYKVGKISFQYGRRVNGKFQVVSVEDYPEFKPVISPGVLQSMISLRAGEVFSPEYLRVEEPGDSDQEIIENAYGSRAYIDAQATVLKAPNLNSNTIDIVFQVIEGDHFFDENGQKKWDRLPVNIGLIKIEGNTKTKDFVIRRELAISPGEPFDLGKMHNSRRRIEGLRLFQSVRTAPEYSERERGSTTENLIVSVKESNTGRFQIGGGFSTDYGAFAHVIVAQENFDIGRWRRPYFWQGGGQKVRLKTTAGGRLNNYELDFEEPWLMGRKLRFTTNLYTREMEYFHEKFDVEETGVRFGLERAMFGNEQFRGRVNYTAEDIGLVDMKSTASTEFLNDQGNNLISKIGTGLTYDTRGGGIVPTKGQRTSLDFDFAPGAIGSEKEFYGMHLKSAWYFTGLREGHTIELLSQVAVVDNIEDGHTVPYLYRHGLGGSRSLRGYDFREVGPRGSAGDYIGGNTMVHATLEYTVPTPFDMARFATFYDIGAVNLDAYDFNLSNYNDDLGIGLRLEIPFLGPIRFDYAVPLTDDGYNGGGGRFSVNMGYSTTF